MCAYIYIYVYVCRDKHAYTYAYYIICTHAHEPESYDVVTSLNSKYILYSHVENCAGCWEQRFVFLCMLIKVYVHAYVRVCIYFVHVCSYDLPRAIISRTLCLQLQQLWSGGEGPPLLCRSRRPPSLPSRTKLCLKGFMFGTAPALQQSCTRSLLRV